jgi:isopenicillin-N epimerase
MDDLADTAGEPAWCRQFREECALAPGLVYVEAARQGPTLRRIRELVHGRPAEAWCPDDEGCLTRATQQAREEVAAWLGAGPDAIVLTRNATEANNLVSTGLRLGPGDEVVAYDGNHPSNREAWLEKAVHSGFAVKIVPSVRPHPGHDQFVAAFLRQMTGRTALVALTHVTNASGDLLPVGALCELARERGVLSLVDGTQAAGALQVDLQELQADFYTASAQKWLCGPIGAGVLYVSGAARERVSPVCVGLHGPATGAAARLERLGMRDWRIAAGLTLAVRHLRDLGPERVERRIRRLAAYVRAKASRLPRVNVWTSDDPSQSAGIVTFGIDGTEARTLVDALRRDGIHVSTAYRDREAGIRVSPHAYNTLDELALLIDRLASLLVGA